MGFLKSRWGIDVYYVLVIRSCSNPDKGSACVETVSAHVVGAALTKMCVLYAISLSDLPARTMWAEPLF